VTSVLNSLVLLNLWLLNICEILRVPKILLGGLRLLHLDLLLLAQLR